MYSTWWLLPKRSSAPRGSARQQAVRQLRWRRRRRGLSDADEGAGADANANVLGPFAGARAAGWLTIEA